MTRAAFVTGLLLTSVVLVGSAIAQTPPGPAPSSQPPANVQPAPQPDTPDTWIFSGILSGNHEGFSGTLVAGKNDSEIELRLTGGATCDGGDLKGEVGFVRLPEITCSDDRRFRALFVPQSGQVLKVFGHVGTEKFSVEAHLLGTEAIPEPKQTAQPKGPLGLPPADGGPPR